MLALLFGLSILLAAVLVIRPSQTSKALAFTSLFVLPLTVSYMGVETHIENSNRPPSVLPAMSWEARTQLARRRYHDFGGLSLSRRTDSSRSRLFHLPHYLRCMAICRPSCEVSSTCSSTTLAKYRTQSNSTSRTTIESVCTATKERVAT